MGLTIFNGTVLERTTAIYTATFQDENGVVIKLADLVALTLTLYDKKTGTIINDRDKQNVLNANNVVVHATSGLLTWIMQPADNVIISAIPPGDLEVHIALFEWTWDQGNKHGKQEVRINVRQLTRVP